MTKTIAQQALPFRQPGDKGKEEIEMTKFTVIINGETGPHKYQVEAEDYITAESIATEQHVHACPFESLNLSTR
ncbi:hypothetical protein [Leclercia sp.]|uniref:hypothetical protein n=1 Tax=Leclercia sp. TaxID=1898428 RepID=UPI0028B0B2DE|nr:hypothetical protein [Leclercia sp.]